MKPKCYGRDKGSVQLSSMRYPSLQERDRNLPAAVHELGAMRPSSLGSATDSLCGLGQVTSFVVSAKWGAETYLVKGVRQANVMSAKRVGISREAGHGSRGDSRLVRLMLALGILTQGCSIWARRWEPEQV